MMEGGRMNLHPCKERNEEMEGLLRYTVENEKKRMRVVRLRLCKGRIYRDTPDDE